MKQMERAKDKQRVAYIDALRGVSCFFVILNHVSCCFLPGLMWYKYADSDFSRLWLGSPLNSITGGNTAVQFFFVISGYLIAYNASESKRLQNIEGALIKRIRECFIITTPSIVFAFILMRLGLMFNQSMLYYGNQYFLLNSLTSFILQYGH